MTRICYIRLQFFLLTTLGTACFAQRVPVLNQIDLPHNYYFREMYLPQLTSGPSSVAWLPDGKSVVYSMAGSLWRQSLGSAVAEQLTDDLGYDYQPDVSPNGNQLIFTRYNGHSMELVLLNMGDKKTYPLTDNKAVNVEPRWSPDGKSIAFVSTFESGHFLLHTATINGFELTHWKTVIPDRTSKVPRYYYSMFDHAIHPVWTNDSRSIYFVSNREVAHGTGNLSVIDLSSGTIETIHREETSWRMRPDISPDGTRVVYSSYQGRNWHQLWMLPTSGGYPMPLTYGDYDNSSPRWSPDGRKVAFISNRNGNTSLWTVDVFDGRQQQVLTDGRHYLKPHTTVAIQTKDVDGNLVPARISISDRREKFFAPADRWIHGDDSRYLPMQNFESHYFHATGSDSVSVPMDKLTIHVSHGPAYEIVSKEIDAATMKTIDITLRKLETPGDFGTWWSGDVHAHMNYGGSYRNTPVQLAHQAATEDLNFVFNLIVNKEQRIPDIAYFSTGPDKASTKDAIVLHGQEFHTSFWGHLGILNLKDHYILPDYSGYPQTAVSSLFPHNGFVADRAHEQKALVGYVHPFEEYHIYPDQATTLSNSLPVDAALGKVDYYELVGFADHLATADVWYRLLNAGLKIPAAAGTDAMANFASLRGPIGVDRVYVRGSGPLDVDAFLKEMKAGRSFVTNGPLIGLTVEGMESGDSLQIQPKGQTLSYKGFLRSNRSVDRVEIIFNGEVIARHAEATPVKSLDIKGKLKIKESGWILMRAWNSTPQVEIPDVYAYASTNPIFIHGGKPGGAVKLSGAYFIKWLDRLEEMTKKSETFRTEEERMLVLADIRRARIYYAGL
ncbi:MAG: CehA/McbA family metallohydrolase [Cytophagales bacterium]|nr:CehA/McbA family metallohydrolase [Cytophagales bacterium]